jgi:hypothetical protein
LRVLPVFGTPTRVDTLGSKLCPNIASIKQRTTKSWCISTHWVCLDSPTGWPAIIYPVPQLAAAPKYVACYPSRFRSVPLVGSPAHSCFRVAPPRFQEAQAPTAIARMCSAARCLSNCGPSFKGLVAARLCDAAHCLCNQGLFSIPILLLLLALLPLQALALVTHASAPGVGTSALKNG